MASDKTKYSREKGGFRHEIYLKDEYNYTLISDKRITGYVGRQKCLYTALEQRLCNNILIENNYLEKAKKVVIAKIVDVRNVGSDVILATFDFEQNQCVFHTLDHQLVELMENTYIKNAQARFQAMFEAVLGANPIEKVVSPYEHRRETKSAQQILNEAIKFPNLDKLKAYCDKALGQGLAKGIVERYFFLMKNKLKF